MTYQTLYQSCYTAEGRNAADKLRHLHGFETQAEESDVDAVSTLDILGIGGTE